MTALGDLDLEDLTIERATKLGGLVKDFAGTAQKAIDEATELLKEATAGFGPETTEETRQSVRVCEAAVKVASKDLEAKTTPVLTAVARAEVKATVSAQVDAMAQHGTAVEAIQAEAKELKSKIETGVAEGGMFDALGDHIKRVQPAVQASADIIDENKKKVMTTWKVGEQEMKTAVLDAESIELGSELLPEHGCLLRRNALLAPLRTHSVFGLPVFS